MPTGQVKWFDVKKGFGFIVGPSNEDVFVHFSSIKSDGFRTLKDGETVEYELHQGDKGCYASDVKRSAVQKPDDVESGRTSEIASTSDTVPAGAQAVGFPTGSMAASPVADDADPEEL